MEGKEKLIYDIIMSSLPGIKKIGEDQDKQLKDLRKNGYGDIHPFYQDEMKSGLSYTHGYSVGHTELAKNILSLLEMTEDEIIALNKENERIAKENKKYMKNLLKEIKSRKAEK